MRHAWWLAAAPAGIFVAWLVSSEILGPPEEPRRDQGDLSMPGDRDVTWIERAEDRFVALRMKGTLVEAGAEQLVIRQEGAATDAVVFVSSETIFFVDGRPAAPGELPPGGEVLVTYDLDGERRIASRVDAMPPGEGSPPGDAAAPIAPRPPGAKLKDGLPPNTAPAQPEEARPPRKAP
ncbi:MAG TPA: hypothetical protein VN033_00075 [Vulgatibacter sp.]|nr:hypothetical protein [Vulgatibacter sp.]